jgi:Protein of unknown function (DUF1559)
LTGPNFADLAGDNPGVPYYSCESGLGTANFVGSKMVATFICPVDASNPTGGAFQNPIAAALNPSDAGDSFAPTNYSCNGQVFGLPYTFYVGGALPNPLSLATITDGTSNTIFFGERFQYCDGTYVPIDGQIRGCFWAWSEPASESGNSQYPFFSQYWETGIPQINPSPGYCDYSILQTPHATGMVAGMGDGSVRIVQGTIALPIWQAIETPNGAEVLPGDWDS